MTERFFPHGRITRNAFEQARSAARLELQPVQAVFGVVGAIEPIGTSGTMSATMRVAKELGIIDATSLTVDALDQLIERVLTFASTDDLALDGLSDRRAQVWPGGLAILAELFGVLRIDALQFSESALREGLLYDLLGRL
jgi:exopolyphosphatase/guanosine-5'-triphosphate,3'-diphosphate pyrophosphatase